MATMLNGALPPPRQIRFVHTQCQPPSKRRRINAACLTCRRRKTRCAGERPSCSTCIKNGHACQGYRETVERKKDHQSLGDGRRGSSDLPRPSDNGFDDGGGDDDDDLEEDDDENERRHAKSKLSAARTTAFAASESRLRRNSAPGSAENNPSLAHGVMDRARGAGEVIAERTPYTVGERRHSEIRRVPYFRYFGPTAIVPGFKQMVVSVKNRQRSNTAGSFSALSPSSILGPPSMSVPGNQPDGGDAIIDDLPVYDPSDSGPVSPLILDLVQVFFLHLGCNYPFLHRKRFSDMVKEKRVEPILVDAVCALAARFSDPAIFARDDGEGVTNRSEFGQFYAQRAKAATVDTFPCPSVGAVQAYLLMAYEGFGANQDSALWMYLGLAIRMAADLGLQKVVGVKYQGERDPWYTRQWAQPTGPGVIKAEPTGDAADADTPGDGLSLDEQREVEQERIDTFWAVFTLDRVISSGTGRPVTFRDDDFELSLPGPLIDPATGWPDPYPHFVRIIHLYGRVSDVLNNVRNARDLTTEKWNKLAEMETELTKQHQSLDQRLEFNAGNFRRYVDAGKGTTFILLHFWFHALIVILHQPTLLAPFGSLDRTHQLLPNSRELSMSSAKTIADILAFAELIDPKSFIGNPFTSQPMYIAACAFLMESLAIASKPVSPESSPFTDTGPPRTRVRHSHSSSGPSNKHSLLASAANQNYQRCYNSLAQLHTYWGGVKYILTALDQKSAGIWDVETYTHEEYESTKPPRRESMSQFPAFDNTSSPKVPPIAWSLTGTMDSASSNLTLMYQGMGSGFHAPQGPMSRPAQGHGPGSPKSVGTPPGNPAFDPICQSRDATDNPSMYPPAYPQPASSALRQSPMPMKKRSQPSHSGMPTLQTPTKGPRNFDRNTMPPEDITTPPPSVDQTPKMRALAAMPHQSYTPSSRSSMYEPSMMPSTSPRSTLAEHQQQQQQQQQQTRHMVHSNHEAPRGGPRPYNGHPMLGHPAYHSGITYMGPNAGHNSNVITFDSLEVDINSLGMQNEMMPSWLEYGPVMNPFDGSGMGGGG